MIRKDFSYCEPNSVEQAAKMFNESKNTNIIAGGTDIVPLMKYNLIDPEKIISLTKIDNLNNILIENDKLIIGSMVTLNKLAVFGKENILYSALGDAAKAVASPQIRNVATVGGNLLQEKRCFYFNQSLEWRNGIEKCIKLGGDICLQMPAKKECCAVYYSDLATILIAASSKVSVYINEEIITKELKEYLENRQINDKSIILNIQVPILNIDDKMYFKKYAIRNSIDFALANAGLVARKKSEKTEINLILGAMGPNVYSLIKTADILSNLDVSNNANLDIVYSQATSEIKSLIRPIREVLISPQVKKKAVAVIQEIIREFLSTE